MAAPDKPNNVLLAAFIIGSVVTLVAMVVGVMQMFTFVVDGEVTRKVLEVPNTQLRELRARDESRLNRYQWVDQQKGVVRLPIERAVELTLRDWKSRSAAPAPAATEGAAPAAGQPGTPAPTTPPAEDEGLQPAPAGGGK